MFVFVFLNESQDLSVQRTEEIHAYTVNEWIVPFMM